MVAMISNLNAIATYMFNFYDCVDSQVGEVKADEAKSAKQVRETEQLLLPGQFGL